MSTRTTGTPRFSPAATRCTLPPTRRHTSCCRSFLRGKLPSKSLHREEPIMRRIAAVALAVLGLFVFAAPVSAHEYPNRTVTIIVPYPGGGPLDELSGVVASAL